MQTGGTKKSLFQNFLAAGSIAVCMFLTLFVAPNAAHAGIFSFLTDFFSDTSSEAAVTGVNSQNIDLLQPVQNPDLTSARGGGEITIVGGTALLSETGPSGTLADIEDTKNGGQISRYVVHDGDSLSRIAKMFGVSVNTIIWANDLGSGSTIREGQTLIILPVSGVRHVIKKGDTVKSIATKYKADLGEVLSFNSLQANSVLAEGDIVIIPDAEPAAPTARISSGVASRNPVRGAGGPNYEGYYLRPLIGGRLTQGLHGYNGVDLAAPEGTPILAAATGEVIVSKNYGWNGGYGNYIVISHENGTQTLYSHLSQTLVFEGYRVVRGQVIGLVGTTGKSTGPHVHFEVRGARNPFQ